MSDDTLQQQTEAEKMLLEEEWSLIEKLPVKRISQLCRLVGIASARTKAQKLEKVKEWREERLNELEAAGGAAVGEGQRGSSTSAALAAARAGKRRRRSEEDSEEEDDESEASVEDDEVLDDNGAESPSLFDGLASSVGANERRLIRELNRLDRERKAASWFPDRTLSSTRCQHEYDFIKRAGRLAHAADRKDPADVVKMLDKVLRALEERALVVVVGDEEGWDTASCLVAEEESFLSRRKNQVKEARKKAEGIRRHKGKAEVFRGGRRKGRSSQARGPWPTKSTQAAPSTLPSTSSPLEASGSRANGRLACYVCGGQHLAKDCSKKFGGASKA